MEELVFIPVEKPPCPECRGTGKITLFMGIVDCEACKPKADPPKPKIKFSSDAAMLRQPSFLVGAQPCKVNVWCSGKIIGRYEYDGNELRARRIDNE